MPKIITTSELQRHLKKLLEDVSKAYVIVTNRGKATMVVLPYFEENDRAIEEYLEDLEMYQNAAKLKKEFRESERSGLSDLVV